MQTEKNVTKTIARKSGYAIEISTELVAVIISSFIRSPLRSAERYVVYRTGAIADAGSPHAILTDK